MMLASPFLCVCVGGGSLVAAPLHDSHWPHDSQAVVRGGRRGAVS